MSVAVDGGDQVGTGRHDRREVGDLSFGVADDGGRNGLLTHEVWSPTSRAVVGEQRHDSLRA
jgi:hypothetical protein